MAKKRVNRVRVRTWYVTIGHPDPKNDIVEKVRAVDPLTAGALCMPPSGSGRFIKSIRSDQTPRTKRATRKRQGKERAS